MGITLKSNSDKISKMYKVLHTIGRNRAFLLASLVVLPVFAFIAYKNAKIDMLFADAISDNNLLQTPFISNDINIQAIHTHLLKWPLAILENTVGFNFHTHAIISFLLLLAMNIGIGYIIYRVSGRNKNLTALLILALASVELLTGISANEGTLTMLTIRNIEIPLMILLFMFLVRQKTINTYPFVFTCVALGILFVTDQLLLFTSVIGAVLYYLYGLRHSLTWTSNVPADKPYYIGIFASAVIAKVISWTFGAFGIANFYELQNTNDKLVYVASFKQLIDTIILNIGKIFDVFGASFFNQPLVFGPVYIFNLILLLATVHYTVRFLKDAYKSRMKDSSEQVIVILLLTFFFAMLVFTILIPRELAGRYFAFLPVIGLILIAYYHKATPSLAFLDKLRMSRYVLLLVIVLGLFATATYAANKIYYSPKYNDLSVKLGDTAAIVNILEKENVSTYITMDIYERGYWDNEVIKQQFDEKTHKKLAIESVFCGSFIVDRQFSRKSWVTANGSKVSIRVKGCDIAAIENKIGTPAKIYSVSKDDHLLIYNNDIRNKFDFKQFDTNSFVK